MIASIKGNSFNVNNGWEIIFRVDEQFDSGLITVQANDKKPPAPYTYLTLVDTTEVWYMFSADVKSSRFDREEGTWQHELPLIELTEWFTTIKTPVIRYTQPLDPLLPLNYETLKDMTDRVFAIAFPELQGEGVVVHYSTELLAILLALPGFDYTIPEGNLFSSLLVIFDEFNGIPRLERIVNGEYYLGVDFKNKENNEIELDEYDDILIIYSAKDYGTMGESRGLNVVNTNNNDNDSSNIYTKETIISVRSDQTVLDEANMIHKLFYPIKDKIEITFKEVDKPSNNVEITKYVVTGAEYEALFTEGFVSGTTDKYKQNCIRFDISGDKFYGWGDVFKRTLLPNITVWKELIRSAQNNGGVAVDIPSNFELVGINANYKSILPQSLIRVAKENIDDINRYSTLQTNQGGNIVDLKKVGNVMHADIQSSGNQTIVYTVDILEVIALARQINDFKPAILD